MDKIFIVVKKDGTIMKDHMRWSQWIFTDKDNADEAAYEARRWRGIDCDVKIYKLVEVQE